MSEKVKVRFYNAITGEYIGDAVMNSLTEDEMTIDGTEFVSQYFSSKKDEFECTISNFNSLIRELCEKSDYDEKTRPNPVFVPKHIEHRKRGRK